MNNKHLRLALSEITSETLTNGSLSELWKLLPDYVAGPNWVGEIVDAADSLIGYFYDIEDHTSEDKLSDYVHEIANGECEDYYSNINKRVQDLSLWAYPALDYEVAELTGNQFDGTLTGLNSIYLYAAMRELYSAIAAHITNRASELEELESELTNA
jgi:hypothetical protein